MKVVDEILGDFKGPNFTAGITEENIQSRLRGLLLMALSNRYGYMVLATGNKSEYAVGYSTLYGDMCGGFAPIKDVWKTDVFKLCEWRNKNFSDLFKGPKGKVIPENIIKKAQRRPKIRVKDYLKSDTEYTKLHNKNRKSLIILSLQSGFIDKLILQAITYEVKEKIRTKDNREFITE